MIAALAGLPLARVTRTRRGLWPIVGWTVAALGITLLTRRLGQSSADRAVLGLLAPFVLPLLAYGIAGAATGSSSVREAVRPLVSFGAGGARAALTLAAVAAVAAAVVSALLACALLAVAHRVGDVPLGHDLATTAWVTALAGAAHTTYFLAGASFGRRGGGRGVMLFADWLLGSSHGAACLFSPYAHTRSLLGGAAAMGLSQHASTAILVALLALCTGVVAWRGHGA